MKTKLSLKNVFDLGKTHKLCVSTRLLFLILALSPAPPALSQIPQGFNYQAIARDGSGNPIMNTALPVMITIQADSLGTAILWQELHSTVTSNNFGMINLVIGRGARQSASTVAAFSDIDWSITPKFIKTEIDYSGWKTMGVSRLWSVPYAMVAEDLAGSVKKLAVEGETALLDEALFEVKNKNGQTIFAVYNEGVRIYVDDGAKGPKGGFAVGGFDMTKATKREYFVVSDDSVRIYLDSNPLTKGKKSGFAVGGYDMTKGIIQNYLDVSADSVRVYIDSDPTTKKLKGGFAVGGYDMTKAPGEEYLRVTRDSTRVNVNNNPAKGLKGGFSVGGFDATKGSVTPFTSLTPKNYFIGHEGGQMITTGQYNSIVGYQSGKFITSGESNAFLGYQAGYANTAGTANLFLGYQSGSSNTTGNYNTFLGYLSGNKNTIGIENTFTGSYSGNNNSTGSNNTFIGYYAGFSNVSGNGNIFEGTRSGYSNTIGEHNLFLGTQSGQYNVGGNYNIFLGYQSGNKNTSGSSNTFIGRLSGFTNTTGGNNVFLGNSAGYSNNASNNVFLGFESGYSNSSGTLNSFIGYQTGRSTTTGYSNVFLGNQAGYTNINNYENVYIGDRAGYSNKGNWNTMIGFEAGMNTTGGASNIFIGNQAGLNNVASSNVYLGYWAGKANNSTNGQNVFIGRSAGENYIGWQSVCVGPMAGYNGGGATTGRGNVFLGFSAGYSETGNYRLHIASGSSSPTESLIYGEFDNKRLIFNANVGIGTTTPGYKLHAIGDIYANGGWLRVSGNQGLYFESWGGGWYMSDADWIRAYNNKNIYTPAIIRTDGTLQVADGSTLNVVNGGNFSYRTNVLFANTSGNVGIGTASPATKLHIAPGEVTLSGSVNPYIALNNGTYQGYLELLNNNLSLTHAGSVRLAITTLGMVGLGTTSPGTYRLYVSGSAYCTGSWAGSDVRWKKNISGLSMILDEITQLNPVYYEWKKEEFPEMSFDSGLQVGLIAQEVEKLFPELVKTNEDGYKAVSYEKLTVVLLEGMKEQQQQIDELKALVEQLINKGSVQIP